MSNEDFDWANSPIADLAADAAEDADDACPTCEHAAAASFSGGICIGCPCSNTAWHQAAYANGPYEQPHD